MGVAFTHTQWSRSTKINQNMTRRWNCWVNCYQKSMLSKFSGVNPLNKNKRHSRYNGKNGDNGFEDCVPHMGVATHGRDNLVFNTATKC